MNKTQKPSTRRKLTKKQKAFADEYLDTGNGVQSALKTYDTEDYQTASAIAKENLQKPLIVDYLQKHVEEMKSIVVTLARTSENDTVRLNAAKDVIDRVEGKAVQRQEGEHKVIVEEMSKEQALAIMRRHV